MLSKKQKIRGTATIIVTVLMISLSLSYPPGAQSATQPLQTILPVVYGIVRDGLDFPKDGIPDRTGSGLVQVLNTNRADSPFEDRGILEFSLVDFRCDVPNVVLLELPVFASDGPYPLDLRIYAYAGDGRLQLDDFGVETMPQYLSFYDRIGFTVRVTDQVRSLLASSAAYAGFNLRTVNYQGFVAFTSIHEPDPPRLRCVAPQLVVTKTDDTDDGICNTDCSLREAIELANSLEGADTIHFNIPGAGPHRIQPQKELPPIVAETVIDGFSQPGAKPNSNPIDQPINATLQIELVGRLELLGRSITIKGLAIHSGILAYTHGGLIVGNFLGTDASGMSLPATPKAFAGVEVSEPGNVLIGGATAEARNLIAGFGAGVFIDHGFAVIQGNFIGSDVSGIRPLGNVNGIVTNASGVSIGGVGELRNLISGNHNDGIQLSGSRSIGTVILGNVIGADRTGAAPLGNGGAGIDMTGPMNTVGGTGQGEGNLIAWNQGPGVVVATNVVGNRFLGNRIFQNGGLGIDLGYDGVTLNDVGDGDEGANQLQNFPEIDRLEYGSNNTVLVATLHSKPNSMYRVELFYEAKCDESGFGEGEKFVTAIDILTDDSGTHQFAIKMGVAREGYYFTATVTDSEGNTSEFSKCIRVSPSSTTITIRKEAQPDSVQDFAYYGPFGKFLLDDAVPDDGDAVPNSMTYTVKPGTYNFAEGVFQSWYLADIACNGSGTAVKNMPNRSVSITVKAGDQMTCTFVTQRRVNLQAIKFNDLNADGIRQANEPTLTPWEFRFYKSDGSLINHKVTDANGIATQNNLIAGSLKVCETPKAGWTNTLPGQIDPVLAVPCYNITLQPGQNAAMFFGNTQALVVRPATEIDPKHGVKIGDLPDINEPEGEAIDKSGLHQQVFLPMVSR